MDKLYDKIRNLSQRALIYEVLLSPKPGLVDRIDSGAHDDMDIYTFVDSSLVLGSYFYACTKIGYENPQDGVMALIRPLGIGAEEKMYRVTGGVNVHKGAIFLYGILCSAIGSLYRENISYDYEACLERGRFIAGDLLQDFSKKTPTKTYGQIQYEKYGLTGIRGEVVQGFPSVKKAYTYFKDQLDQGLDTQIALGNSLIYLMTFVADTNIIARGGMEGLAYMKKTSQAILACGAYGTKQGLAMIRQANVDFIQKNISPGGCADLVSLVIFLYWLEGQEDKR